jgi:hypothetical protein
MAGIDSSAASCGLCAFGCDRFEIEVAIADARMHAPAVRRAQHDHDLVGKRGIEIANSAVI